MEHETSRRKIEHLELCSECCVESRNVSAGFEDVTLVHRALPEISMNDINTSVDFFGKKLSFPFLIASITGGHPETTKINAALAKAAEEVGSESESAAKERLLMIRNRLIHSKLSAKMRRMLLFTEISARHKLKNTVLRKSILWYP
jgi:L-lactate dehydrogenase (FMN-dependent) and related alpha-hydroxy acid dehydrogenases